MSDIISMLKSVNAIITDSHIVYTSGKHGSVYVNKDALYPHTQMSAKVGEMFAKLNKDLEIDVVVAPALGGIILSQWTAFYLSQIEGREILGLYTEKDSNKKQTFTRGYDSYVKGKKILVIEDLTTTGGSVLNVIQSVREAGGEVVMVSVMVNRDPEKINAKMFNTQFSMLGTLRAEAYDSEHCPLCQQDIPINTVVGHGKKYLESLKS